MTPKKAHYLLIALLVLTLIIIGTVLYFGRKSLTNTSQKVVDAKLNIVKATKEEETYIKNKQIYIKNEVVAEKLNVLIPTEKEQALAVETIYTFANNAGLSITSIVFPGSNLDPSVKTKTKIDISQATPVKDLKDVYEIPVEVSIKGGRQNGISTNQLLQFIESIESSPRNMRITSITYDTITSEVKFNISLYVKKQQ
jgi:hypothetical protein